MCHHWNILASLLILLIRVHIFFPLHLLTTQCIMDFQLPRHQAGSAASGSRYIRDYVSQVLGISKDVDSTCSVEMLSQYLIDPFYSKKMVFLCGNGMSSMLFFAFCNLPELHWEASDSISTVLTWEYLWNKNWSHLFSNCWLPQTITASLSSWCDLREVIDLLRPEWQIFWTVWLFQSTVQSQVRWTTTLWVNLS